MSVIQLYRIPQVVWLTTGAGALMNYPVNRTDFSIPRYVDTEVQFWIKDFDRRAVDLTGATLTLKLIDPRTETVLLSRALTVVDAVNGLAKFNLTAADTSGLPLSSLSYSIIMTVAGVQSLLYTDRDRRGIGTADVVNGPIPPPVDPYIALLSNFTSRNGSKYSSAYAGAANVLDLTGQHSVVNALTGWTGTFAVQASLESNPTSDADWFNVMTKSYVTSTQNDHITFEGNFLWVRFVVTNDTAGTLSQITYRN
jgi:hypothetical protein